MNTFLQGAPIALPLLSLYLLCPWLSGHPRQRGGGARRQGAHVLYSLFFGHLICDLIMNCSV